MKLLFLYGPPATGKLTVASEIAKQTDFKLFHNHLTLNLARELYPEFGSPLFGLTHRLRLTTFEYAAEKGTNIIFTNVYSGDDEDTAFVNETVARIKDRGGEVIFIRLYAPLETLVERAGAESRKQFRKLTDATRLKELLAEQDPFISVPYDSLAIDTSRHSPSESANLIIKQLGLKKQ